MFIFFFAINLHTGFIVFGSNFIRDGAILLISKKVKKMVLIHSTFFLFQYFIFFAKFRKL